MPFGSFFSIRLVECKLDEADTLFVNVGRVDMPEKTLRRESVEFTDALESAPGERELSESGRELNLSLSGSYVPVKNDNEDMS